MITKSGYGSRKPQAVSKEKLERYRKLLEEPQKQQGANPKDAYKGMLANPNASSTIIAQPQTGEQFLQQLKTKTQMSNERAMPQIQKKFETQRLEEEKTKLEKEINTQKAYMAANDKAYKDLMASGLYSNVAQNSLAQKTNAENKVAELQKQLDQINTKIKVNTIDEETKEYTDTNKDTFFGRAETNFDINVLQQKLAYANNDYLDNPTEENKKIADAYRKAIQEAQENNPNTAGKGGWLDKSLAGYLPQLGNRLKAGGLGGATGAVVAGGLTAAGTALLPTVGEEVLIPKATMWGFNLGSAGASAADTYKVMRGMAYQGLLDEGIDEETARLAASDEAFVNAAIEFIGNLAGGFIIGTGKLAGKGFTTLLSKSGNKVLREAGERALKKGTTEVVKKATVGNIAKGIGKAGIAVGIDALGEGGEEASQQIVSIANIDRATQGKTGKLNLVSEAIGKAFNLTDEEKAEVAEATIEGIKISLLTGGGTRIATDTINMAIDNNNAKRFAENGKIFKETDTVDSVIKTGLESDKNTTSYKLAKQLQEKMKSGQQVTDEELGQLFSENVKTIAQEEAIKYSPVNAKQVLAQPNIKVTKKGSKILPTAQETQQGKPLALRQGTDIYVTPEGQAMTTETYSDYETGKLKLPTIKTNSVYQAAKGNVDVKIANRLMDIAERTNARVEGFYDENPNIEGSYKDGVIRINVNSNKAADTIFAHEFTHHLESTNAWKDVRDAIINSNTLYNMLSEQGINIDEYKQQIKDAYAKIKTKENPNGIILDDVGVEKEIVAKFVESKLMKDEKTIVRMINENPSFMQRLKNFWDDLVVRFKETAEEKELRRIQNIYNKAFAEAQKGSTQTTETKYSISEQTNTDNQGRKLSQEQQEFFKDSKVRDENGRLLEVYHGTEANVGVPKEYWFNIFDIGRSGANGSVLGDGFYFTTNLEHAQRYAHSKGNVYTTYLNITNPFKKSATQTFKEAVEEINPEFDINNLKLPNSGSFDGWKLRRYLIENGYDGVELEGTYVAFYPNQIKNVDNLNPTSDPDIRYSIETDKQTSTPKREKVVDKIAPQTDIEIDNLPNETEKVARILTKAPKKQQDFSFETVKDVLMRKIVDAGNTINTIGKIAKDDVLYPMYNNTKQARQSAEYMIGEKQTDITGTRIVGNSLIEVFEPVKRKGEEYTGKFYEYLLHMHNIDRMAQDKPVFGKSITAEDSKRIADQLLKENPEFERLANRVYVYNRNLMQWRVDSGLVSQEQADEMNRIYPHYVPTFRDMSGIAGAKVIGNSVNISQTLKKATGSDRDILPIDLSMARQTMQTVQAAKRNLLGNRLLNDALANKDQVGKYITTIEKSDDSLDIDEQSDAALSSEKNNNIFKIYRDGKSVNMYVNNGIFEGLKAISSQTDNTDTSKLLSALSKPNTMFKQLVTGFNPMFMLKNPIRDVQDATLYSKNLREFAKEYPQTFKEMVNNSKDWQLYKSLGGTGSTFFDYETGIENELNKGKLTRAKEATLGRIEYLNMLTEQAPRFAEFKATLEKAGNRDYDTLLKAVYNAADVTVNFGRSGSITQILNKTAVPFLNPSIQGTSKTIRTIVTTKGGTEWAKLVTKFALFGILPSVLNELLYWDDEDYEKLNDRDKDVNFVLKYGDNQWIKIPKGRVISFLGNLANRGIRVARGQEVNWGDFLATTLDQTAPISPFESNIVSPIKAVKDNKTWYGSDIVPQRLQQYEPRDQYDEKTDAFSKWLGGILNYSPKKINYLIDAYTGVIGDFALPLTTPTAEKNPFVKAFTIDGTFSNEIGNKFYETKDKYNKYKNDTPTATVVTRYLNKQNEMASDLYAEIRKVQSSDISDKEKKAKASELRELINLIQANAVLYAEEYEQVVNKYINKFPKNPDRSADYAYLMANYELFGPEYAVKTYNLSTYNKNKHKNMQTVFNQIKNNFNTTKPVSSQKTETLPTAKDIPTKR